MERSAEVEARVRAWLDEVIVGRNLCPFAAPVLRSGRARIVVAWAERFEDLLDAFVTEVERLHAADPAALSTTLLVAPDAPEDFDEFHGVTGLLEEWLERAGLAEALQIVTFHPRFRFADSTDDDLSVYVNRAPYPIWHLLRQAEVNEVIEAGADTRRVVARNVDLLESLGPDGVRDLFVRFLPADALPRRGG